MGKPLGATFLGIAILVLGVGGRRYFESQVGWWISLCRSMDESRQIILEINHSGLVKRIKDISFDRKDADMAVVASTGSSVVNSQPAEAVYF